MELTITQAAQSLDCSVDTVRRHIRRGKLSARKDEHGRYLIQFDDAPAPAKKRSADATGSLDWLKAPHRRRDDPGHDEQMTRLLEERETMIHELQMWRSEAMAAQASLEELRRQMPRTIEPKRARGWWRFGR